MRSFDGRLASHEPRDFSEHKNDRKKEAAVEMSLIRLRSSVIPINPSVRACVTATAAVQCRPRDHGVAAA